VPLNFILSPRLTFFIASFLQSTPISLRLWILGEAIEVAAKEVKRLKRSGGELNDLRLSQSVILLGYFPDREESLLTTSLNPSLATGVIDLPWP
jgi:hypothetical protein